MYLYCRGTRKSFNSTSTSTLLEESLICPDDRVVRNISFRRKKNRLRKKTLVRETLDYDVKSICHNKNVY